MSTSYFLLLTVLILSSHAAQFTLNNTIETKWSSKQPITSGLHIIKAIVTIPDMFVKATTTQQKRRLKEVKIEPTAESTPAPTTKVTLPVILLIHSEGAQDRSHSLYGSALNKNIEYKAQIFEDLKTKLVNNGKMAVIQYDKRNCKPLSLSGHDNISNNLGPEPLCTDPCPNWCPKKENTCLLSGVCYNNTNITVTDIVNDAENIFNKAIEKIKTHLNEDIVDFNRIWSVPIGFSSQGAAIAMYIASKSNSVHNIWPTVISLMGAGIPIDLLLQIQLRNYLNSLNQSKTADTNSKVEQLKETFECIKNGTLKANDIIGINNESKYVQYWTDWLQLFDSTDYYEIENFMSINSGNDKLVPFEAYKPLRDMFAANATVEINTLQNINHYMIDRKGWENGVWSVDHKVSEHIIGFVNDISGYLDGINRWIRVNNSSPTTIGEHVMAENSTVYKVLLYVSIMSIVFILSSGVYCIIAKKVCPYEFEDVNLERVEGREGGNDERAQERRRRRRHRRHRRHRRSQRNANNYRNMAMVELNEPMIQNAFGNGDNNGNNVLLDDDQNVNINGNNDGNEQAIVNENENNNQIVENIPDVPQAQNEIVNEYVD